MVARQSLVLVMAFIMSVPPVCIAAQTVKGHALQIPVRPAAPNGAQKTELVRAAPVSTFKLLSPGTGWASLVGFVAGPRLLWTSDNGQHWKDISPPNPRHDSYADIFFLDESTGWVLFASKTENEETGDNRWESDWALYVSATSDGGRTWTETHVQMPPPMAGKQTPSLTNNGNLTFSDRYHGWLMLEHATGSAFSFGSLLSTSDGGHTWQVWSGWKGDNPGFYGDIRALPSGDLWALNGDEDMLYVKHAGQNVFEKFSVAAPAEIGPDKRALYSLPVFEDRLRGYVAVSYARLEEDAQATAVLFYTADGGRAWKPDRTVSGLNRDETVPSSVVDSTWVLPFTSEKSQHSLLKVGSNDRMTPPPHQRAAFSQCRASFTTPNDGWMNCSGELSATTDGGTSWTPINPRFHSN
jgi:photosystem II stability/assembly factor-like uncharacterized protein